MFHMKNLVLVKLLILRAVAMTPRLQLILKNLD